MKKVIITGLMLFTFAAAMAQEKGTKNIKPIKNTKGTNTSVVVKETKKTTPVSIRSTNSNSTNRAAQTTVETNRPEKVNNNRAAASSAVNTSKAEKVNNNRAAQTSVETNRPEKVKVNERTSTKEEKPSKEVSKLSVEYCRGWKNGYMKAWTKSHKGEKLEIIPNCETIGNCEGYKCGFKAGMKAAELNIR